MSQSDEPSYYEVALTNRQVVVAFVILLGCLLVAFFSGVWIGKGRLPTSEQVVAMPPPNATVETGKAEPLDFFEDIESKGSDVRAEPKRLPRPGDEPRPIPEVGPPSEAAKPSSVIGEEDGSPAANPRAKDRPADSAADRPAERTEPRKPAGDAAKSTPKPKDKPAPAKDSAAAAGRFFIQVFASPARAEAVKVRDRLRSGGQKASLSPSTVDGKTLFRVRVGPFKSRDEAQGQADTIRRAYRLDTWVTQ